MTSIEAYFTDSGKDCDRSIVRQAAEELHKADSIDRTVNVALETREISAGLILCDDVFKSPNAQVTHSNGLRCIRSLSRRIGAADRNRFLQRRRAATRGFEFVSSDRNAPAKPSVDWGHVLECLFQHRVVDSQILPTLPVGAEAESRMFKVVQGRDFVLVSLGSPSLDTIHAALRRLALI